MNINNKNELIRNELNSFIIKNFFKNNDHAYLYHYTDLDSAKSIIENEEFWVSDAFTTNDEKEIIHVKDIINVIVNEKYHYLPVEKKGIYLSAFDRACELMKSNTFILCFSLIKNSESLWKDYARKNGTTGVCLRFDFNNIAPNNNSELPYYNMFFKNNTGNIEKVKLLFFNHHITYDINEKRTKIEEYIELVTNILESIKLENFDETLYVEEFDLLADIFTDILLYSFISKESSWSEEKEYRMIFIFPEIEKYGSIFKKRNRGTQEIKYVALNMKSDNTFSLDRIFVYSEKDSKIAKSSLKNVLNEGIKIKIVK